MSDSKIPFKSGFAKTPGKGSSTGSADPARKNWSRPRRWKRNKLRKLEKIKVVDPKQQKIQKLMWVLKWVVGIPLTVYLLWWFILIIVEAFI